MKESVGTTEICGEVKRFDQRQSVFYRAANGDLGSDFQAKWRRESGDPLQRMLFAKERRENCFLYHLEDAVDGRVAPRERERDNPVENTRIVKEMARWLGVDLVGIARLDPRWVYSHSGMWRKDPGRAGSGIELNHQWAIVVAIEMDYEKLLSSPSFIDDAEVGLRYADIAKIVVQLAGYIRELGYPAKAHHVRTEDVLHVPLAVQAGLGELARNGILMTEKYGPRVRLGTVTTDLPLVPDQPVDLGVEKVCSICKKCADNCPSGAVTHGPQEVVNGIKRWTIDPERCIRLWVASPEQWDNCSACIKSCPWSKPDTWYHRLAVWMVRHVPGMAWALVKLDDLLYGKEPKYRVEWLEYVKEPTKGKAL